MMRAASRNRRLLRLGTIAGYYPIDFQANREVGSVSKYKLDRQVCDISEMYTFHMYQVNANTLILKPLGIRIFCDECRFQLPPVPSTNNSTDQSCITEYYLCMLKWPRRVVPACWLKSRSTPFTCKDHAGYKLHSHRGILQRCHLVESLALGSL